MRPDSPSRRATPTCCHPDPASCLCLDGFAKCASPELQYILIIMVRACGTRESGAIYCRGKPDTGCRSMHKRAAARTAESVSTRFGEDDGG